MKTKEDKLSEKKHVRWWLILTAIFLILIIALGGILFWFETTYAGKFYPGTKVGYLNISGQTKEDVLVQLKNIEDNISQKGLVFKTKEKEIKVSPVIISQQDPDLAKTILTFDWQKTIDQAFVAGRTESFWNNLANQVKFLIYGNDILIHYNLNKGELIDTLKYDLFEMEIEPVNAQLKIDGNKAEVSKEQDGQVFNYEKAVNELINNIELLDFKPIEIEFNQKQAEIKKEHTGSALNGLEKILELDSFKITVLPNWWRVEKKDFIEWLEFQIIDDEVVIGLNKEKVLEFLKPISELVDVSAQDAKFELKDGRVTEFKPSRDGKKLDLEQSFKKINQQVMTGSSEDIDLIVEVAKANVETEDVNDLGIEELIGRGTSNFAGSPVNRRHNIATGAAALNGILIKPGEEFSLLAALGEIDGKHGYKQELVIKGNRTIPEYGGGLCQIGTTTFRVALRSGLPITMRRNHSYRVVYYEPAGMDATIYNPAPDMKFLNDTSHHILFITYIDGNELIFEFYGTKDERKIVIEPDPPSIFNVSSPGAPRYIETEELAPGEKKKIESAHNGADTYFKYTVVYPNGEEKVTDFNSHYVAWPEVWMIGKEPEPETASSTEEVIVE